MKSKTVKNGRKFLLGAFALSVSLSLTLSGCKVTELFSLEGLDTGEEQTAEETEKTPFGGMSIALYTGEKLDPFTSVHRSNRALLALCYDSLVSLDNTFTPFSETADWVVNGDTVIFTLREDALFSNGKRVTAEDCRYSFDIALREGSSYARRLSKVVGYSAIDTYVFTVRFRDASRFNVNLLTVPIVSADGLSGGYYTGSGRYCLSDEDGILCLRGRTDGKYGEEYEFTRIGLFSTDSPGDLTYNFNYGRIYAAYADLSLGTVRYKGNVELVKFPTLDTVFAVLNGSRSYLKAAEVSKAFSYAIDRQGICNSIFDGLAQPVWQPFCPGWSKTAEAQLNSDIFSPQTASELLSDSGWGFSGTQRSWKGEKITLEIICNSESLVKCEAAELVAESLRSLGFSVKVTGYMWEDYIKAVNEGNFDIYIGESVLSPDMDITALISSDICMNYRSYPEDEEGQTTLEKLKASAEAFLTGEGDLRTAVADFFECQPFIPLYYTEGALAVNRTVSGDFLPYEDNIYNNIETWTAGE